ncbi:MAG: response regulator [Natrialbaceae archaeon]|nr:response regulator [Natrialbaceae archaeon]
MAGIQKYFGGQPTHSTDEEPPESVVVLTDDIEFEKAALLSLSAESRTVESASSLEELLSEGRLNDETGCLVCDYELPTVDGLAVLEIVRARYPDLPVILYLSESQGDVAVTALAADVTACLTTERHRDEFEHLERLIDHAHQY